MAGSHRSRVRRLPSRGDAPDSITVMAQAVPVRTRSPRLAKTSSIFLPLAIYEIVLFCSLARVDLRGSAEVLLFLLALRVPFGFVGPLANPNLIEAEGEGVRRVGEVRCRERPGGDHVLAAAEYY